MKKETMFQPSFSLMLLSSGVEKGKIYSCSDPYVSTVSR